MNEDQASEILDNEHDPSNPVKVEKGDPLRLFIMGPTGVELSGRRRLRLAVLALENQDFGFTQQDVEIVSRLAQGVREDEIGHRSRLQDLAKRIQRLLPRVD